MSSRDDDALPKIEIPKYPGREAAEAQKANKPFLQRENIQIILGILLITGTIWRMMK